MKLKDKMTTAVKLLTVGAASVVMFGSMSETDVETGYETEPQADMGQAITLDGHESWTQTDA